MNKFISPLIASQFPSFYNEDYPNLIAFVRAYYEWMEQSDLTDTSSGVIGKSRSLSDYQDIDRTEAEFLNHFRSQYLFKLPLGIITDNRLLVKHILELYRTKGTPRAYELLFRLLFNTSIEIYIPNDYLFRTSNAKWYIPHYIEVNDNPYLSQLVGKGIVNSSKTSRAVVENYTIKYVNNRKINVLYLSSVDGSFKYGETIYSDDVVDSNGNPLITVYNGPRIIGSFSFVAVENGGYGFNPGDLLDVTTGGVGGKVKVVSTRNENGKVTFNLQNGGFGFTTNAVVTVATTVDLNITNLIGSFNNGDKILDTTTNANGTVTFANSSFVQIINFSSDKSFVVGDSVSNTSGTTATVTNVIGGAGTGASFKVGDIVNKQLYIVNTDKITNYQSAQLDDDSVGFNIQVTGETGAFTVGNTATSSANIMMLQVNYNSVNTITTAESLSNSALGISGLNVFRSDGSFVFVTGAYANLNNANIVSGTTLISNITSSIVTLFNTPVIENIVSSGNITFQNTSVISVKTPNNYFVPYNTLTDTQTGRTATITGLVRNTNWQFPGAPGNSNLDSIINQTLIFKTLEVGTIAYLSSVNPGSGYSSNPYVDVIEPDIYAQGINDGSGGYYGHDAIVSTTVSNANGIVTAVQVVDSGFGFAPDEKITMTNNNKSGVVVTGKAVLNVEGNGYGYWINNEGFLSDIIKLQDSYYYQQYSYEIVAERMLSSYESLVKDLVHPSGIALFGRYSISRYMESPSTPIELSVTQS